MTMTNEKTVRCAHCMLEINRNQAIQECIDGEDLFFCCHGCEGVYKILKTEGFSKFYSKRDESWQAGAALTSQVSEELFVDSVKEYENSYEVDIALSGIRCAACIWLIENYLNKAEGVESVRVNYATHKARIRWTKGRITLKEIIDRITSIGYCPLPLSESSVASIYEKEKKDYFYRFSIAAFFTMQLMIYTVALYAGYFQGINSGLRVFFQYTAWALCTPVMFYSGWPFIRSSLTAIRKGHTTMDTLIFLGSFTAYVYSVFALFLDQEIYFDTTANIITLILLGRYIEAGAKVRTSNAVSKLLTYQPSQVRLLDGYNEENYIKGIIKSVTVPVKQIRQGDLLEVLPGDSVPADGEVIYGRSEVNESMLTGEASPRLKTIGEKVFAGTGNINGSMVVRVEHTGSSTTLSRIVQAVEDAQASKAPIQNIADKVVGWFVPAILAVSMGTFIVWYLLSHNVLLSVMTAVSVLVIACPCALGLATPLAILIATSRITKMGAIAKSGDTIETFSKTSVFLFDKTGTITKGELKVEEIIPEGMTAEELLTLTASLERNSSHLIAKAVTDFFTEDFVSVSDFAETPGKGVSGSVNGRKVTAGTASYIKEQGIAINDSMIDEKISKGLTAACVAVDSRYSGVITLSDSIKPDAEKTLKYLADKKLKTVIVTGDNRKAAEKLAERLNVKGLEVISDVTPFQKADIVRSFQKDGRICAMVGDGINDAPALTTADIGIAIGQGTDIAIESSDIVLMREELGLIKTLHETSVKTLKVIKENLFWAFSYNLIMIPLAVTGKVHPVLSAAFMSVSSLLVVFNSLRIKN
ncbi:MAG: heavy metal translocating P-type ATPase [Deferribacterales bacterium]